MQRHSARSPRTSVRDRHGRGLRSAVTGPDLPPLHSRAELFDLIVGSTAEYLKDIWPDELATATFEVAALPARLDAADGIDRWHVDPVARRVTLYRLPIERLARVQRGDETQRRMMVESCVFRAVAELLGKDPWDLAPERFRHL